MAGWSQDVFERECLAWMDKLKSNPAGSELVCLEFSHWQYQPNYLYRRLQVHDQTDAEVHIAWSSSYQCPLLLMRSSQNDFKVNLGFVGGLDFHPTLHSDVFFVIHACETKARLELLAAETAKPGASLLQWWAVMANAALNVNLSPEVFQQALKQL